MSPQRRGLLAMAASAPWLALAGTAPEGLRRSGRALFGSPAELLLPERSTAAAEEGLWQALSRMNRQWNAWKPGELQTLNQAFARGSWATASPALLQLLRQAATLERASLGLFNPAIGALVSSWGFHADQLRDGPAPDAAVLRRWRAAAPSLAHLAFSSGQVTSHNPAVRLDLGAYAKGVAIDQALDRLQQQGVAAALLNLGGNLAAFGMPGARPWRVGVRDPDGTGLVATVALEGREAAVTSGIYERQRRLADGSLCHHVIDPGTGRPADAFSSVTVLHPSAALADAAATALLVAGPRRWQAVARRMGVQAVLLIDRDGRLQATPALAPRLQRV